MIDLEKFVVKKKEKPKRSGLSVLQKLKQEGLFEENSLTKSEILPNTSIIEEESVKPNLVGS